MFPQTVEKRLLRALEHHNTGGYNTLSCRVWDLGRVAVSLMYASASNASEFLFRNSQDEDIDGENNASILPVNIALQVLVYIPAQG